MAAFREARREVPVNASRMPPLYIPCPIRLCSWGISFNGIQFPDRRPWVQLEGALWHASPTQLSISAATLR